MSIAGIAKEVSTISISAWFFGDELTPLNITGVGITVCGTNIVANWLCYAVANHAVSQVLPCSRTTSIANRYTRLCLLMRMETQLRWTWAQDQILSTNDAIK